MIPMICFLCYCENYCLPDFFLLRLYSGRLLIFISLLTKDVEHSSKSIEMLYPHSVGRDCDGAGEMPPGLGHLADPGSVPHTSSQTIVTLVPENLIL